jgi:hypothetical protein
LEETAPAEELVSPAPAAITRSILSPLSAFASVGIITSASKASKSAALSINVKK